MRNTLLVMTFALTVSFSQPNYSWGSNAVFPIISGGTVCVFDSASRELRAVYIDTTGKIIRSSLKVSPSGKYLDIRGYWHGYYSKLCDEEFGENNGLFLVINVETGDKLSLCNVMGNAWAPGADRLVYIEGHTWTVKGDDWEQEYYLGKAVKIFDAATGETTELALDLDTPGSVAWPEYDSNIYISELKGITKYDPVTGGAEITVFKDVNISPDGNYCFLETLEGDPAALYRNVDNSEVTLIGPTGNEMDADSFYPYFLGWGRVNDDVVAYINLGGLYYIDCATGELHEVKPPSPEIDPVKDLAGFRQGRPVWAKINGEKAELYYY